MKSRIRLILLFVLATFILIGCRSIRDVQESKKEAVSRENRVQKLMIYPPFSDLSAKIVVASQSKMISGQLKMRWDKSIQISISALGMVELGRLEFLTDKVVVINRINRTYSELFYSDATYFTDFDLDYYVIQSLLWNRLFVSGERDLSKALKSIIYLSLQTTEDILCMDRLSGFHFLINSENNLVGTFRKTPLYQFDIKYGDFDNVNSSFCFPKQWLVSITIAETLFSVEANLQSLSVEKGEWVSETKVNSRYSKITLKQMLDSVIEIL